MERACTIEVPIRAVFLPALRDFWLARRGSTSRYHDSVSVFLAEWIESELATYRAQRIMELTPRELRQPLPRIEERRGPRNRVPAATVQKILFLSQSMNTADLARRFGLGATTITRILQTREEADVHVLSSNGKGLPR